MNKLFEAANLTPHTPGSDEVTPEHPLHFHHLIHPVLRTDLPSFNDFQEMCRISSRSAPSSRVSSGNYGGLNVLGLGSLTNNSTSSLPAVARSPSSVGGNSPRESGPGGISSLKDEKFYKRSIAEDIEPTLRLDIAPGLSWMARRTVLSSIAAGSLVVEPNPPPPKFRGPVFPCSLCGEARKGDQYARKYRFRTSDTDETKHPLCDWCLGRLRATCDYIGFLRMIAAGHWRAETDLEKKSTWEESVRLRERMFWTRIGGGVIPAYVRSPSFMNGKSDGARKSEEAAEERTKSDGVGEEGDKERARTGEDDPFQSTEDDRAKRISIGRTVIANDTHSRPLTEEEEEKLEQEVAAQLELENENQGFGALRRKRSASTPGSLLVRKKDDRLSLTIPGAFE